MNFFYMYDIYNIFRNLVHCTSKVSASKDCTLAKSGNVINDALYKKKIKDPMARKIEKKLKKKEKKRTNRFLIMAY
eukprot:Pgem_evm1s4776